MDERAMSQLERFREKSLMSAEIVWWNKILLAIKKAFAGALKIPLELWYGSAKTVQLHIEISIKLFFPPAIDNCCRNKRFNFAAAIKCWNFNSSRFPAPSAKISCFHHALLDAPHNIVWIARGDEKKTCWNSKNYLLESQIKINKCENYPFPVWCTFEAWTTSATKMKPLISLFMQPTFWYQN